MKILAIDTSTSIGSAAVLDDEKVCADISYQTKSSHAEVLIGVIEKALRKANMEVVAGGTGAIDGIAVAIGPGSFTGLRIGLATAKGLAMATDKPIVGISSLEALCHSERRACRQAGSEESPAFIVPCINAYRGEVYATVNNEECSITPEALCDLLLSPPSNSLPQGEGGLQQHPLFLFIGDGAAHYKDLFKERLGKRFKLMRLERSIAVSAGLLSMERFKKGDTDDLIRLVPNYIRKSDAELKAKHQ